MNKVFWVALPMCVLPWVAPANPISEHLHDRRVQDEQLQQQLDSDKQVVVSPPIETTPSVNEVLLKEEELGQHPDVVVRAMLAAVLQANGDNVAFLMPYYRDLPASQREDLVVTWAEAVMARHQQRLPQAIRLYRQILVERADLVPIRLQLATTLFANKEWEAAENQFHKLRSEKDLPASVVAHIERYLLAIQEQSQWSFNGGLTYLNDKNINNAPKQTDLGGGWQADKAESGSGVGFHLGVGKKWAWHQGVFNELRFETQGKYYWDNKRYNEMNARVSAGMGKQNARQTWVVLPFFEQTLYAGGKKNSKSLHRFARSHGMALEWSHWLTPKWQSSVYAEMAKQVYETRTHLNGRQHFIAGNVMYLPNAKQYWFAGLDYSNSRARDGDDSFVRKGMRVGWGQEWPKGISTRISATYAKRDYQAAGFFRKVQHNKESSVQASVWHRGLHFWGITPRLTWAYQKVNSNLPLYTYDKHRMFIELNKQF